MEAEDRTNRTGSGNKTWEMIFPCPFQSYLVFGGPHTPQSSSPTAVSLQGHYPEASCLFLGNSLKFQAWPSGYANISRFAEPAKWLNPRQSCENLTATTPRWGKLPRGSWCMEPVLLPIERLLRMVKEKKKGKERSPGGSLGPALVTNCIRDFASKG